jgi:hypothetical protein
MSLWQTNRFWAVSFDLIFIFYFFEIFYIHKFRNRLHGSTNFIIFGPTDQSYGCLKLLGEVWAGRAYAGANEVELTKVLKNGPPT